LEKKRGGLGGETCEEKHELKTNPMNTANMTTRTKGSDSSLLEERRTKDRKREKRGTYIFQNSERSREQKREPTRCKPRSRATREKWWPQKKEEKGAVYEGG